MFRPDVMVDWALKNNYLYLSISSSDIVCKKSAVSVCVNNNSNNEDYLYSAEEPNEQHLALYISTLSGHKHAHTHTQ